MIKNKTKILMMSASVILVVFAISSHTQSNLILTHVRYMEPQYAADFSDDRVLVGASHNIFVGKVIGQVGIKERGIGPETQFNVEVVDNIKGNLKGTVIVNQEGGFEDGILYVVRGKDDISIKDSTNSYLLQTGSTYLFATRYNKKENWYTLNSYPTASKIFNNGSNNLGDSQLKDIAEADSRVQVLKMAYKTEIPLDTDVKNNNNINSYKSIQEGVVKDISSLQGKVEKDIIINTP